MTVNVKWESFGKNAKPEYADVFNVLSVRSGDRKMKNRTTGTGKKERDVRLVLGFITHAFYSVTVIYRNDSKPTNVMPYRR